VFWYRVCLDQWCVINKTTVENGDGPSSRACQGRSPSTDCLRVRSSLIDFSRNCQSASPPGLESSPFVRGAPCPLLLAPQAGTVKFFSRCMTSSTVFRGCRGRRAVKNTNSIEKKSVVLYCTCSAVLLDTDDFSRTLIDFSTVVVVKHRW
jgi:hypothetical protein